MTIRQRLALWYSGLLTVIIVIFSVAVITVSRLSLLQTVDQVLIGATDEIIAAIDPVPVAEFGVPDDVEIYFEDPSVFTAPGVSVQVWRTHRNGQPISPQLIAASDDIDQRTEPLDELLVNTSRTLVNTTEVGQAPVRVVGRPFLDRAGQQLGVVLVSSPLGAIENSNDQLLVITLITACICIGLSIVLGMWLSEHLLEPIEDITKVAASIARTDDLSMRLEWQGPADELGKLTDVFNEMMERLDFLFNLQQRFIGDVSHELRTPLTSILGNLELMQRYGYDQSMLDAIYRESGRISRMVDNLLLLARADFGELDVEMYPIDLDRVILDVFEEGMRRVQKRDLTISLQTIEPVEIIGNADRIRQLMLNLVGNAIKFTSDGGSVILSLRKEADHAVFEVQDTGIGISDEDMKRIFERFFQADTSRVQREETDGAGLGLSIARWIVDAHGGTIQVQSALGEGTTFRVQLPLSPPDARRDNGPIQPPNATTAPIRLRRKLDLVNEASRKHEHHENRLVTAPL